MTRALFFAAVFAVALPAQFAGGVIFQSLDALQPSGVTAIGCPGNTTLSTGEILCYSQGWTAGARALYSAETLGTLLGDRNGDGKPFDWVNIDALHVVWNNTAFQPKPFDFRFSFEYDLVNGSGAVVISSGDIFRLTGNGAYQVTIPRSSFIAALGYSTPAGYQLNVDGYTEMPDGSVLVSFKNNAATGIVGSGNNIISPLFGTPSTQTIYGSDIFCIRPPFGTQPAILVWRAVDFQPLANTLFSNYGTVTEIRDFDVQPGTTAPNNPNDPLNLWNGGNRPHVVFHFYGDENPVCTSPVAGSNVWALVQGSGGVGQFATNLSGAPAPVYMDALAIALAPLPTGSALTMDSTPWSTITVPGLGTTALIPQNAAGTNVQFIARNLDGGAGKTAAFVLGFTAQPGYGTYLGSGGYNWLYINQSDALLPLTLAPPFDALLLTGVSDANGTAITGNVPIPANVSGFTFYVQALQLGPTYGLTAPQALRIL
jgi:hypothetical protein